MQDDFNWALNLAELSTNLAEVSIKDFNQAEPPKNYV